NSTPLDPSGDAFSRYARIRDDVLNGRVRHEAILNSFVEYKSSKFGILIKIEDGQTKLDSEGFVANDAKPMWVNFLTVNSADSVMMFHEGIPLVSNTFLWQPSLANLD